ncbi:MAG: glycoside hydrolase family 3 protein [Candidatus Nanopelagicales bacterium]
MRKRFVTGTVACALATALAGGMAAAPPTQAKSRVDTIIAGMSLDQKIGQLIQPDFRNWQLAGAAKATGLTEMNDEVGSLIAKYHLGGVILFAENVVDTDQTVKLVHGLKAAADNPLFITIDQEGGIVTRLQSGTNMAGNMALGATRSTAYAKQTGTMIGAELHSLGVNTNFAPSVDVNVNPDNPVIGVRSFGSSPSLVAKMGVSYIQGVQGENVIAAAKHFPGHGDTATDSHFGLPVVDKDRATLEKVELYPFKQAIKAGVDMIMTAHVQFPTLDPTTAVSTLDGSNIILPATLSKKILTGVLRDELGFKGVIITDAMNMKAIADNFGGPDAAVRSLEAGTDIVLMPASVTSLSMEANLAAVVDDIRTAINSGALPMSDVNAKLKRIIALKIKRGMYDKQPSLDAQLAVADKTVGKKKFAKTEQKIADAAVTVVRNENETLPYSPTAGQTVLVMAPTLDQAQAMNMTIGDLVAAGKLPADIKVTADIFTNRVFDATDEALIAASNYVIAGSYVVQNSPAVDDGVINDGSTDPKQWAIAFPRQAMHYAQSLGKPFAVMSLRSPYDLANFPEADAALAVYGFKGYQNGRLRQPNIPAGIRAIFGAFNPSGKLPVDVPSVTNPGQILYPFGYGLRFGAVTGS